MNTTITHIEIPAPDLELATKFYSEVFGWHVENIMEGYSVFRIGDTNTGGGLSSLLSPAPENVGPQIVIDVDDIDAMLTRIESSGGKTTLGRTEIGGGHGHYAVFQDPLGNFMQLHSAE